MTHLPAHGDPLASGGSSPLHSSSSWASAAEVEWMAQWVVRGLMCTLVSMQCGGCSPSCTGSSRGGPPALEVGVLALLLMWEWARGHSPQRACPVQRRLHAPGRIAGRMDWMDEEWPFVRSIKQGTVWPTEPFPEMWGCCAVSSR